MVCTMINLATGSYNITNHLLLKFEDGRLHTTLCLSFQMNNNKFYGWKSWGQPQCKIFCCGTTLMNVNFADFSNKTPWDSRHIVYQSDEKGLHKIKWQNYYALIGTKSDLISSHCLYFAHFVPFGGDRLSYLWPIQVLQWYTNSNFIITLCF